MDSVVLVFGMFLTFLGLWKRIPIVLFIASVVFAYFSFTMFTTEGEIMAVISAIFGIFLAVEGYNATNE